MKNINETKKLKWYAINNEMNHKEEYYYIDVMRYIDFERMYKMIKYKGKKPNEWNSIKSWEELRNFLDMELMHDLWSRCEYEMLLTPLVCREENRPFLKIDVYDQIIPNIDLITDYVNTALELGFKKPENMESIKDKFHQIKFHEYN